MSYLHLENLNCSGKNRGVAPLAGLILAFSLVMLGGCAGNIERNGSSSMIVQYVRETKHLGERVDAQIANDPELAIIRSKYGIGFPANPSTSKEHILGTNQLGRIVEYKYGVDNYYPTKNELAAIQKYGKIMLDYFGKLCEIRIKLKVGSCTPYEEHIRAVDALHAGKLTWMQFAQMTDISCRRGVNADVYGQFSSHHDEHDPQLLRLMQDLGIIKQ